MKKVFLIIGLVAMLVLSACSVPQAPSQGAAQPAPVQQQPAAVQPRTIAVTGTGQVTLAPDVAYVHIGVHSQSADVAAALRENNEKAQAVSQALQGLGISPDDIQTSSFNIYPQQQYGPQGEITETTYAVDNTVYVTVRDLQILGQLLDVVVNSGANSINGISFDVLDKTQAISEARRLAVQSTRGQAEEMAAAAGVELGELYSLNVYNSFNPQPMYEGRGGAAADVASVPISSGQIVVRVEVSASYLIR